MLRTSKTISIITGSLQTQNQTRSYLMGFLRSNFQAAESYGARFFCLLYLTPLLPLGKMTKQNFPPPGETLLSCLHCKNIPIFAAVCPSPRPYPAEILTVTLEIKGKLCSATDKTPHASCLCQWLQQKPHQQQLIPLWVHSHFGSTSGLLDTDLQSKIQYIPKFRPDLPY